jgi:NAD(P)-dependent dehydrogenase (short-subunit alcohol dehydrogenase family)
VLAGCHRPFKNTRLFSQFCYFELLIDVRMPMFSAKLFENRRIIVTGASSGIGRASTEFFASLGADVCLVSRRLDAIETVRESLPRPERHFVYSMDLTETALIGDSMKEISSKFGRLSGLFHAAGIESLMPLKVMRDSHAISLLQGSVVASIMLVKNLCNSYVLDTSVPTSVVLMSSVAATRGHPGLSAYSAAKAAVEGATRSLAVELAPRAIRVNAISAGAVETPMHNRTLKGMNEEMLETYKQRHPLGFGKSEDIAHAAAFLLSPLSRWITGTTLNVDGGFLCL